MLLRIGDLFMGFLYACAHAEEQNLSVVLPFLNDFPHTLQLLRYYFVLSRSFYNWLFFYHRHRRHEITYDNEV